jgi:WhiB family redox-sensing transcriptional regulator
MTGYHHRVELVRADLPAPVHQHLQAIVDPGWWRRAACAGCDLDEFFPDRGGQRAARPVLRVCAGCPVRRPCLATALLGGEHGIWAGTPEYVRENATRTRLLAGTDPATVVDELLAGAVPKPGRRGRVWSGKADAA